MDSTSGMNLGARGRRRHPRHLHWHVVPRWGGDTNFMPVVGETRVLPELLAETDDRLRRVRLMTEGFHDRRRHGGRLWVEVVGEGPAVALDPPRHSGTRVRWDSGAVRRPTASRRPVRRTRLRAVEPPDGRAVLARPRPARP